MVDWSLEILGVKPAGQSASAEDADICGRHYDSAYSRLRKRGLAPFSSNAVPDWAQGPVAQYVARDCASAFGIVGEALSTLDRDQAVAVRELTEQVAVSPQQTPVVPYWM